MVGGWVALVGASGPRSRALPPPARLCSLVTRSLALSATTLLDGRLRRTTSVSVVCIAFQGGSGGGGAQGRLGSRAAGIRQHRCGGSFELTQLHVLVVAFPLFELEKHVDMWNVNGTMRVLLVVPFQDLTWQVAVAVALDKPTDVSVTQLLAAPERVVADTPGTIVRKHVFLEGNVAVTQSRPVDAFLTTHPTRVDVRNVAVLTLLHLRTALPVVHSQSARRVVGTVRLAFHAIVVVGEV
mmetsp:Transcript_10132/g.28902  ORF Transcript_10132/g.28902 Transcript_10132/m.28902 type:complete len:240 (+) Transcript_10132:756-1475(+)